MTEIKPYLHLFSSAVATVTIEKRYCLVLCSIFPLEDEIFFLGTTDANRSSGVKDNASSANDIIDFV